jgi:hypothetical protein
MQTKNPHDSDAGFLFYSCVKSWEGERERWGLILKNAKFILFNFAI